MGFWGDWLCLFRNYGLMVYCLEQNYIRALGHFPTFRWRPVSEVVPAVLQNWVCAKIPVLLGGHPGVPNKEDICTASVSCHGSHTIYVYSSLKLDKITIR